ncbi:MAG TPA: hypothetical protein VM581_03040 [Magnetospirillaceae bacterium]|nr:hypothetical protein [Magnetospirillaceae bacterium]
MDIKQNKEALAPKPAAAQGHEPNKILKNKLVWIIGGVIIIAVIAAIIFMTTKQPPKQNAGATQNQTTSDTQAPSLFMEQYGQGCKEKDVAFTSAPMKSEELSYIRPLGAVNDGHVTPTDHVYVGGSNQRAADNTYAVLMPADGIVTDVSAMPAQYIGDKSGQQLAPEDHRIVISHSCRYFSIYIHVHKLSDPLKAAVGTLQPNESKKAGVELKAGDVVGYIGGSTFDWTPIDTNVTLKGFISPKLYEGEPWKIHTVSPFDLYTGALKTQLEAKSLRTMAPVGGKIDYDEPGKLIGTWFREGTDGYSGNKDSGGRYWDGHLSVAPDYIDPTSTIVSIGNWTGEAKQFVVNGTADPAKISSQEGATKYELKNLSYVSSSQVWSSGFVTGLHPDQSGAVVGIILFEVLPGEKLKVEKFPGKTAAQVTGFTSAAQTYER